MAFPGNNYAPPGVYTRTLFENPLSGALDALKIPVFIGEGNEFLVQRNLEVVRGSSKTLDQRIVNEDETGRAVAAVTAAGVVTLGDFDGVIRKFQVRNLPLVSGDGTGTTTNDRSDVSVTIDNLPIVVVSVDGARGIVELAQPPKVGQVVRCTYWFNRTDTRVTDDLSSQVSADPAVVRAARGIADVNSAASTGEVINLHGDILNAQGAIVVAANNVLEITVDGVAAVITIPAKVDYTMVQVANAISAAKKGSLVASTFINNFGLSTLLLKADNDLVLGAGSANALLGLLAGQASGRTKTFYTFQGPIVDGTDGGVTTTDPSHVVVKVDNVQVIPTKVNGATRAVTLPTAPKVGAKVTVQYYFNAWQDTFDYLAHDNVVKVTSLGDVPDSSGFVQGSDFILKNDRILWGTAVTVDSGINTAGKDFFGASQVVPTLIDNRTYLSECAASVTSSGGVSLASDTDFILPFEPTLGNGRDTKLGSSLFQTVSNGRIDLPVNRPDVIDAYWGFDIQDALNRGKVKVLKVEGSVITLASAVPAGAKVFASFYHNLLTDNTFTLAAVAAGQSGLGTYTVQDSGGASVLGATFPISSKGAGLNGVTIVFPSGSELSPDLHFESVSGSQFTGPVEEIVTVQFAAKTATPAKYTVPGAGDYEFVLSQSDKFRVTLDATELSAGVSGLDLNSPGPHTGGFFANLTSDEINYTGGANAATGKAYDLTVAEDVTFTVDSVEVTARASVSNNKDIVWFKHAINEAASGHQSTAAAGGAATITLNATPFGAGSTRSTIDGYYVGWKVVVGNGAAAATTGQVGVVTAYVGSTGVATVSGNWAGGAIQAGDPYYIYNPATQAVLKGATRFNGQVKTAAGKHDKLKFIYVGTTATLTDELNLGDGPFASAAALATEVNSKFAASVAAALGGAPDLAGLIIACTADADGRLQFKLQLPGVDAAGYLQFIDAAGGAVADFAILAGLDTAAAVASGQSALLQGPVARTFTLDAGSGFKPHDRLMLRNRLLPGKSGSMAANDVLDQCNLSIGSGSGLTKCGLTAGTTATAGSSATVRPATLVGRIGVAGGQDAGTVEPLVTFFDGTGAKPANNVFQFVLDTTPVVVTFQASASGVAALLGPFDNAWNGADAGASILTQIAKAISAVPGAPFGATIALVAAAKIIRQEGAGIRLTSVNPSIQSAVVIGDGSANALLGYSDGQTAQRTLVSVQKLVSALQANRHATFATWMTDFQAVTVGGGNDRFAGLGLATVQKDAAGASYLYLQSLTVGAASAVTLKDPTVGGLVTRSALAFNTGLAAKNLDGATGEAAIDGYFVTSNNPAGSGSVGDSILNDSVGQDGRVGQTYRDKVTGLTFTILPRGWHDNEAGPWQAYPTGSNTDSFRINVSKTFTTDANIPHNALNGVELKVSNTINVGVGDTALVKTYERGGNEPAIGDVYYVTYTHQKQDFTTAFFTKMSSIEQAFGSINPNNPVSLAAYLAILNGAVLVGIKQVPRATGSTYASLPTYKTAIEDLEGVLTGMVKPDIIVPLRGDSTEMYQLLKTSNEIQSSIRYKAERTSILGVAAGTEPADVGILSQTLNSARMRLVYPDMATIQLSDGFGKSKEQLIDGPMLAAMLTGSVVSPNVDVATPWTGRRLVGVTQLARKLDAVEQNQVAQKGVTVLEDRAPVLRVRDGKTTIQPNPGLGDKDPYQLQKLPTVILIADEVQRQSRVILEQFIGVKFLPGILTQVEGRLAMMLKSLVAQQIITAYMGVKATVSPDDPTVAEVEAWYSPVFPLLYLVMTFHLRSSL